MVTLLVTYCKQFKQIYEKHHCSVTTRIQTSKDWRQLKFQWSPFNYGQLMSPGLCVLTVIILSSIAIVTRRVVVIAIATVSTVAIALVTVTLVPVVSIALIPALALTWNRNGFLQPKGLKSLQTAIKQISKVMLDHSTDQIKCAY